MQNSASGAPVVRKPSESSATAVMPRPSVDKSPQGAAPRWSGSLHELAERKQRKRVSRPPKPGKATLPAPAVVLSGIAADRSARSRLGTFRHHQRSRDRRWQIPCWLTSFVLHLLAVVVLGSLTVPVSRQRTVMSILLSFGEIDGKSEDGPVELATTISLADLDATTSPPAPDGAASPGTDTLVEIEGHMPAAETAAPVIQPIGLDNSSGPQVVPQMRQPSPASSGPVAAAGGVRPTADADSDEHDQVVERFIEFDIGRLRGAEGEQARQDFNRLGTEALASLIRGLNKSAKMHASCPVVVISQKVGTMLRENPDPALLRYALDNIGRDVPVGAPHIRYLRQLVAQLRGRDQSPSQSSLNVPMLVGSLKSRDVKGAIQAAHVVTSQPGKLFESEKQEVAWALIQMLTHRNADLRAAARTALISVAQGRDCGPADDRRSADRVAAACKWSLELCPERFEAAAESVLNTAQKLADAGKRDEAHINYRKLVQEYAGTRAADEAAELLKPAVFVFK